MFKILIVDDEKKERDGIESLINYFEFDLDISKASNGEEALRKINSERFDILLTDIKMPIMDGIKLLDNIQKINQDMIFVIYSAYGEFEYAQNAISLGVYKYILKPIQFQEFKKVFEEIIELCHIKNKRKKISEKLNEQFSEIQSYKLEKQILTLIENKQVPIELLSEVVELESRFSSEKHIPVLLSSPTNLFVIYGEQIEKKINCLFKEDVLNMNIADNQILLLIFLKTVDKKWEEDFKRKFESLIKAIIQKYNSQMLVVIGNVLSGLSELNKEYDTLAQLSDYQFFMHESGILFHNQNLMYHAEVDMMTLYLEKMYNEFKAKNYKAVDDELTRIYDFIEEHTGFSSIYVKYIFTEAIRKICDISNYHVDLTEIVEKIYQVNSLNQMKEVIENVIEYIIKNDVEEQSENRIVKMAKRIIFDQYYDSNLSLSKIASELHVSPSYMSSLFKVETGENLVKYITQYRIKRAKDLLRETNMKICDICKNVGYHNHSYFTSIFSNIEGLSPGEYRERVDKNG